VILLERAGRPASRSADERHRQRPPACARVVGAGWDENARIEQMLLTLNRVVAPRRVSQIPSTTLSTRALPTHPEQPGACLRSLLRHRSQASSSSEDWPLPLASRGRIGFACAGLTSSLSLHTAACPAHVPPGRSVSRRRLPLDAGPELLAERAIHMADTSQSARAVRVNWLNRRTRKTRRRT
jgi:hypothetical protein